MSFNFEQLLIIPTFAATKFWTVMKKTFLLITLALTVFSLRAQETKTLTWGGQQRQYVQYVPQTAAAEAPVLFMLHGLGDEALNFFHATGIQSVADQKGWIVVAPQALDFSVEIPVVGSQDFGNAWAAGVTIHFSITIYGIPFNYDITVNENVDDAGFILATLDTVSAEHAICTDSVFFAGFSLGGFMCHRMAIEHGDLINSIAAVSGLVGNDMQTLSPVANVNLLQLYGTDDEKITYDGAMVSYQNYGPYCVGLPVEATVDYWRNFNHCDQEAILEAYPDTQNDGLTFEMYSYLNGDNNARVGFLKVNNGLHRWYSGDAFDIDYTNEIVKFFTNTLDVTSVAESSEADFSVWPNPAKDFIQVESQNEVGIYDLTGQLVLKGKGRIDISRLASGMYFVKAGDVCRKLVVK
jgi:polyhydroxybutyrate depolymerase